MNKSKRRGLQYESELAWFVLVGALDVFMTYLILRFSAEGRTSNTMIEGNPIARWVLQQWGIRGMVIFKFAMIAVVAVIAEVVGRRRPTVGRLLLIGGTIVVAAVVAYSLRLLLSNL